MSTTIENVTPGKTLYLKIRANALSGEKVAGTPRNSEWSETVSVKIAGKATSKTTPTPSKATSVKLASKSAGKAKLTWKASKVKGLTNQTYTVRYSYDKAMKNAKTKTVKAKSFNLSKLKKSKKLYAQVRVNAKYKGKE